MGYITNHKDISDAVSFHQWVSVHSPRLLTGLRQWLLAILLPISERHAVYHLPVIHCKDERQFNLHVIMWALSGVLSSIFLGAVHSQASSTVSQVCCKC